MHVSTKKIGANETFVNLAGIFTMKKYLLKFTKRIKKLSHFGHLSINSLFPS